MNALPTRDDALRLAAAGWPVIPLRGKIPMTAHGVKDATTDRQLIAAWWPAGARRNIGARVPRSLLVLDIDPQNGGSLAELADAAGGQLPRTLTVHSGRGTGGRHLYFLNPGGALTSTRLPAGIDVKTETGYLVMPPSLHPDTGQPYRWEDAPAAPLPPALRKLLRPAEPRRPPARRRPARRGTPASWARVRRIWRHSCRTPPRARVTGDCSGQPVRRSGTDTTR